MPILVIVHRTCFEMSAPNILELTLNEILHIINPLREDWETRTRIIDELRNVVSAIESLRGATVEPFGSFLSQLYTRWGDLDISIELSNGSYISTAARKHKQTLLGEVLKALRRTGGFWRLQFVQHARVPILKLESRYQNISCDISINNLSGQMKSKFLLWISLIDRRFRDMVLLVKEWAKANDINNPKTGTLNSYSLSLLVVFHFQVVSRFTRINNPYKNKERQKDEHLDIADGLHAYYLVPVAVLYTITDFNEVPWKSSRVRADVQRRIEEISVANIAKFRKERRINHSNVSELFASFFAKFSSINARAVDQGICTYTGQWEDISTNTRWQPRTYAIFVCSCSLIEDPFEQPENTARAVNSNQLTRIAEAFTNTYLRLTARNQTRNSLIPSLVRPELSRFFPGVAFRNGGANGGSYSRTNQNTHRGNHSQFQTQLQKARQVSHSDNMTTQKPKQAYGGQTQMFNQHFSKGKPGSQPNKVRQGGPQATQGQQQVRSAPQVKPQVPHTSVQGQVNNVGSQRSGKGSQGQVWRPKQ
ncbi:hypothetical protein Cgig2_005725 [Carnegiea gigantea]|uniref:Poly(A) RNA polymerase mitochondrial-like central palm domain-containing protein n=1 Tax=Carnegiea gigantea TaxID=171969 RepID=A0A9Q1QIL1_9CARY|nr:hypothetical protein Cgig2_005725 [Carnegiea gigantea]